MTDIYIRKDFFQLFLKNLALIWKYVTKTDIAKSRVEENWNIALSQCLASTLRRWTVSYECVMVTGLMLACHHVTLHTVLWIPDLSYCPHGPHVTMSQCHNVTGASQSATHHLRGVDSPTYKYHLRNDKKVLSWLVLLSPPLWCWYVAPPQSPADPRQTCRGPVTGAELFIIELRNCRSGLNLWIPGGDWLVINIIGGNYVSCSDTGVLAAIWETSQGSIIFINHLFSLGS